MTERARRHKRRLAARQRGLLRWPQMPAHMRGHYRLNRDGRPIRCTTWHEWMCAMRSQHRLAHTRLARGGVVSTVFLGFDHNWRPFGDPVLFETMVFGGPLDGAQIRYGTRAEALAGHAAMLAIVIAAQDSTTGKPMAETTGAPNDIAVWGKP